jgi:hypothetical protein
MSNPEIASMSLRNVEAHLTKIYREYGLLPLAACGRGRGRCERWAHATGGSAVSSTDDEHAITR